MSLAVFILPQGDFLTLIKRWKDKINIDLPNQKYTLHPPHLTMLNLKVKNEINALQIISKIAESFSPFEITVEKADVFLNDSATGGHTLFFRIKKNKFINDLQLSLANALQNERVVISPPKHIIKNKIFLNSFNEYGSPFIGEHWIPHFSISSLKINQTDPIIKQFLSLSCNYSFKIHQLSTWRVQGDIHTQITTPPLK